MLKSQITLYFKSKKRILLFKNVKQNLIFIPMIQEYTEMRRLEL